MTIKLGNQLLVRVQEQMTQNISAIKNQLMEWLERPESGGVEQVVDKFSELGGSLSLLSQNEAATLSETLVNGLAFLNQKIVEGEYTGDDDYFIEAGAELAAGLLVLDDYIEHLTNIHPLHVSAVNLAIQSISAFIENREFKANRPQPQISSATYEALVLRVHEITETSRSQIDQYVRNKDASFNKQTIINNNNNLISLFDLLNLKVPILLLQKINESINTGLTEAQWIEIAEAMILVTEALSRKGSFVTGADSLDSALNKHTIHSRALEVDGVITTTAKMAQSYFQQLRKDVVHYEKITSEQPWLEASHFLYQYGNAFSLIGYEQLGKELCHLSLDYAEISLQSTEKMEVAYPPVVDSLVAIEHIFSELLESNKIEDTAIAFLSLSTREIATALPISAQAKSIYQSYATRKPQDDGEDADNSSLNDVLSDLDALISGEVLNASEQVQESIPQQVETSFDGSGVTPTYITTAAAPINANAASVTAMPTSSASAPPTFSASEASAPSATSNASDISSTPLASEAIEPAIENSSDVEESIKTSFDTEKSSATDVSSETTTETTTEEAIGKSFAPYFSGKALNDLDALDVPEEKSNFLVSREGAVIDEEIREFFMEEFQEIVENIREIYPSWRKDVLEGTLTNDIRRAFHTLKGSGRTVGYESLGEFAWQHERLLNGVIEKLYPANTLVQETIGDAVDLLFILNEQEEFVEPKGALLSQALAAEKIRDAIATNPDASEAELMKLSRQLRLSDGRELEEDTTQKPNPENDFDFADVFGDLELGDAPVAESEPTQIAPQLTSTHSAPSTQQSTSSTNIDTAEIEARVRSELQAQQEETVKQQVAEQSSARAELGEDVFNGIAKTLKTALSVGEIDTAMEEALAATISRKFGSNSALVNDESRQEIGEQLADLLSSDSALLGQILDRAVGKFTTLPAGLNKEEFSRIANTLRRALAAAHDEEMSLALANSVRRQIEPPTMDKIDELEGALTELFTKEQNKDVEALPGVFRNIRASLAAVNSSTEETVDVGISLTGDKHEHVVASVGLATEQAENVLDTGISLTDEVSEHAVAAMNIATEQAENILDTGISLADEVSEHAVAAMNIATEQSENVLDAGISLADEVSEHAVAAMNIATEQSENVLDTGISLTDVSEHAVAAMNIATEQSENVLETDDSLISKVSEHAVTSNTKVKQSESTDSFDLSLTNSFEQTLSNDAHASSPKELFVSSTPVGEGVDLSVDDLEEKDFFDELEDLNNGFSSPVVNVVRNAPANVSSETNAHAVYSSQPADVSAQTQYAQDVSSSGFIPSIHEVSLPSMPLTSQVSNWSNSAASTQIQAVDRLSQELSTISNVETPTFVNSSARSAVFLRAVDRFENLSQMAESGQGNELIDDLLDSVYDIEDSIEPNSAPQWVWHVLDSIEQLLLNYKHTGEFISFSAATILRHSAGLIENYHENTEDEALEAISELMNERKDSVKEYSNKDFNNAQTNNSLEITPTILDDIVADPNAGSVLAQTFIDEAMMLFNRSQNRAEDWDNNTNQTSHLDAIRRDMHTLKGSARMAGYSAVGDLTHAVESLIESIVDGYTEASSDVSTLLSNAMWQGTVMIDSIREGFLPQPDPRTLNDICACLNQPLPYPNHANHSGVSDGEYREIPVNVPLTAGDSMIEKHMDAVEDIFGTTHKEADLNSLDELENMLAANSGERGASIAPTAPASDLSQIVKDAVNSAVNARFDGEGAINESVDELADMFNEPTAIEDNLASNFSSIETLHSGESLVDDLSLLEDSTANSLSSPEMNAASIGGVDAASAAAIASAVASAVTDAMNTVNENNLAFDEDLAELKDAFEESKVVEVPVAADLEGIDDVLEALSFDALQTEPVESVENTVETVATEAPEVIESVIAHTEEAKSEKTSEATKKAKTTRPFDDSIDPALIEIFTDEAQELLQTTSQLLSGSLADANTVNEFKRAMHTLKGGARLIGFTEIGDTSHLMESVVERMDNMPSEKIGIAQGLLSTALEALYGMVDNVLRREMPEPANAINQSLKLFTEKGEFIPPSEFADDEDNVEEKVVTEAPVVEETKAPELTPVPEVKEAAKQVDISSGSRAFDDSIDPVLVEIFTNEAQELFASASQLLQGSLTDENTVNELKRAMHTVKGGARLVGFANSIGDTSHLMESVVDRLERYPTQNVGQAQSLLNTAMESLFSMLDSVLRSEMPDPALAINESLKLFAEKGEYVAPSQFVSLEAAKNTEESAKKDLEKEIAVQETLPPQIEAINQKAQIEAEIVKSKEQEKKQEPAKANAKRDTNSDLSRFVRVDAELLDEMIAMLGESAIMRSRMENVTSDSEYNLNELTRVATRISEQVRRLDNETEAQMLSRRDRFSRDDEHFDPLEMDRFSELQQLSRQLSEAIDDLKNIQDTLSQDNVVLRNLTLQQGVVYRDLQDRLLATQLMRFDIHEPRLKRLIKQTSTSIGKEVNFILEGGEVELERRLLDDLLPSLEHMIRNSIAHGIETPEKRLAAGKSEVGTIKVAVSIRASEISVRIIDDGAGIDYDKIRAKAKAKGMLDPERAHDENYLNSLMMKSGFSTAENLSQLSGRGVGMDVVHEMLKQRRGQIHAYSIRGKGTEFDVTMPFSMSIAEVLLVEIAGQAFAAPMSSISAVAQMDIEDLRRSYDGETIYHRYQDTDYRVFILGKYFKPDQYEIVNEENRAPVLLINTGGEGVAFHIDRILNRMEIIVKNVNRQVLNIPGISGATILGDGRVVPVLELLDLSRRINELNLNRITVVEEEEVAKNILVVDDSVTMRKVSTRLLERNHYNVATAKDGLDAIDVIQTFIPDLIMLDIEMPRMDGFEFASHVRQSENPLIKNIPIIMITSRTGDKHRERADQIGVQGYLGKPYREDVLLETLDKLLQK